MRGHKGKKATHEELKAVAELYREAQSKRISVQQYVAQEMNVAVSTANKRIMASRKANLLPPYVEDLEPGKSNPICVFTISQNDLEQLSQMANAVGVTRSSLVREAVRLYMNVNS
jgi:predicted transcriptional regulator